MFPACAGMNLLRLADRAGLENVPRVRGDEPMGYWDIEWTDRMFPACAGMNRLLRPASRSRDHVPRVRGDEPDILPSRSPPAACSPRARG